MTRSRLRALAVATGVHAARFVVIVASLGLAPVLGLAGWYQGLFVNLCCCLYAAGLVTWWGLWPTTGITRRWAGRTAAVLLVLPAAEALVRVPATGLADRAPGFGLWGLTLFLVGINEELTSRGVVLTRLSGEFGAVAAVGLTGALFGLQHLSLFATTGRGAGDIVTNVLASACYGFALAAYQHRFHWIWPLVLVHATADFTTVLAARPIGVAFDVASSVAFVLSGGYVLRGAVRRPSPA